MSDVLEINITGDPMVFHWKGPCRGQVTDNVSITMIHHNRQIN